jgi:hypothetical protein
MFLSIDLNSLYLMFNIGFWIWALQYPEIDPIFHMLCSCHFMMKPWRRYLAVLQTAEIASTFNIQHSTQTDPDYQSYKLFVPFRTSLFLHRIFVKMTISE